MVFGDIHGSSGGMADHRVREFRNARSMNFSAPRISGTAARTSRKTAAGNQKKRAARFSSTPQKGPGPGALRRRETNEIPATARTARRIAPREKPSGVASDSA